jgi:hypothetical protein
MAWGYDSDMAGANLVKIYSKPMMMAMATVVPKPTVELMSKTNSQSPTKKRKTREGDLVRPLQPGLGDVIVDKTLQLS